MKTLRCIKHDLSEDQRSRLGFEVDLSNCDQNEIKRANFTNKLSCKIICEHFKWKAYDSEVNLRRIIKPEIYLFNLFLKKCSVSCGEGHKLRSFECYDIEMNRIVDSIYCNDLPRPNSEYLKCNFTCYRWQVSSWSLVNKNSLKK